MPPSSAPRSQETSVTLAEMASTVSEAMIALRKPNADIAAWIQKIDKALLPAANGSTVAITSDVATELQGVVGKIKWDEAYPLESRTIRGKFTTEQAFRIATGAVGLEGSDKYFNNACPACVAYIKAATDNGNEVQARAAVAGISSDTLFCDWCLIRRLMGLPCQLISEI